mgnify:CR=1 FL=1
MLVQPAGVVTPHMHTLTSNVPQEIKVEPPKEEVKKVEANGTSKDLGTFQIGNVKD